MSVCREYEHMYGILIQCVPLVSAVLKERQERSLSTQKRRYRFGRQGDTNYRNLRVFPVIYTLLGLDDRGRVYHYSYTDYRGRPVSFCGDRARRVVALRTSSTEKSGVAYVYT